jgi:hypothetical protein
MTRLRIVALAALAALAGALPAQDESFAALQQRFRTEAQQLGSSSPTREQQDALLAKHLGELNAFVAKARGDDHWNGRLMLADLLLVAGKREEARQALAGIDPAQAPALLLVNAAAMAPHVGLADRREAWLQAAIERPASSEERLAMARLLCLTLHDVTRGEQVFATELGKAKDDEARALVRFHRADTMRDREDLPDNAGWEELEKLAKDLPDTYWGGVAKDRFRAVQLRPGDPAIEFAATSLGGREFSLRAAAGKVLVLAFWVVDDRDNPALWSELRALQKKHGEQVEILAICLDRGSALVRGAVEAQRIDVPVAADGKGILSDAAVRWFVEGPGIYVVDKASKVAGLRLFLGTADGRREFADAVAAALR